MGILSQHIIIKNELSVFSHKMYISSLYNGDNPNENIKNNLNISVIIQSNCSSSYFYISTEIILLFLDKDNRREENLKKKSFRDGLMTRIKNKFLIIFILVD